MYLPSFVRMEASSSKYIHTYICSGLKNNNLILILFHHVCEALHVQLYVCLNYMNVCVQHWWKIKTICWSYVLLRVTSPLQRWCIMVICDTYIHVLNRPRNLPKKVQETIEIRHFCCCSTKWWDVLFHCMYRTIDR